MQFAATITSPANTTVKELVRLHNRRHRTRQDRMLIDGIRPTLLAIRTGYPVDTVYVCPEALPPTSDEQRELIELLTQSPVRLTRVSTAVGAKIACRENSDGIIAVGPLPTCPLDNFRVPPQPLLLLVEGVEKPGNLGAMLRTAEGAGVDGVIICDPLIDLGNPNVVRASMGTIFTCPLATTTAAAASAWLREHDVRIIAATPEATTSYWDAPLTDGIAITVGAEHAGLSDSWRRANPNLTPVAIPMAGQADSLNVATAAALLIYEARRQRR